jgi:thiol-disulfide isomerase/thioredoxin
MASSPAAPVDRRPVLVAAAALGLAGLLAAGALVASRGSADDGGAGDAEAVALLPADARNPLLDRARPGADAPTTSFALLDGGSASLADHAGRPVVVNFFGSWCEPCVAEMPDLERAHQRLGDRVAFVGLAVNDPVEAARGIVAQTGVSYQVGRDGDGALLTGVGGVTMPTTALVDAGGRVVDIVSGRITQADLEARVARAFGVGP